MRVLVIFDRDIHDMMVGAITKPGTEKITVQLDSQIGSGPIEFTKKIDGTWEPEYLGSRAEIFHITKM